jgi:CheY-like chemotaxis protein
MSRLHTILVVDDDPGVRDVLRFVLEDADYVVHTAVDGYEAVRLLTDRHVDLMLTDIRMPGLTGFELGRQAKLLRPNLHVIYLSGYYSETEKASRPIHCVLLEKPVRPPELLNAIKRELRI